MTRPDLEERLSKNFSTKQLITILNAVISKQSFIAGDIVKFVNKLDKLYPDISLLQSYFYPIDSLNEIIRELELAGFVADTRGVSDGDETIEVMYDNQGLNIISFSRALVISYIINVAENKHVYPNTYSDEVDFLTRLLEVAL